MSVPPPTARTNVMAIVSFVAAFVVPVAGLVLGYMAKNQIRRTGEEGRGLATAGIWIGMAGTIFGVVFFIIWLSLLISMLSTFPLPSR
jgi:hypothetical protein